MAKKEKDDAKIMSAVDAVSVAFEELDDLDCINLQQGKRVRDAMSTGSLSLDLIKGGGNKPGLMETIFGPEGSGKSTLINSYIVSAQSLNIPAILYDPESGSDPVYMRTQGVDLRYQISVKEGKKTVKKPGFFYTQPECGEDVYRHILRTLRRLPIVDDGPAQILFLIDSFEGMASEEVDEKGEGGRIADEARMHSYYLKRVVPRLRRRGAILVGTNQMRTAIGTYGNPQQESGGRALRYWPGYKVRVSVKRVEADKIKVQTLPVIWRTTKNKAFPPHRSTDMRIMMGRGLDPAYDALYFLKQLGYIEVRGGKTKILLPGHGKVLSWKDFRRTVENPEFRAKCFAMLRSNDTYRRYFEHSKESTYFYDADYTFEDEAEDEAEDEEKLAQQVEDDAAEYDEMRRKRRKRGKRPHGKSKKQDHEDLAFDEEMMFDE